MEGGAPGHTPEREPRTFLPPGPGSSASERPALSRAALFSLGPAGEAGEQGGRGSAAKVQPQALLGEGTDSAAGQGPCGALPGATARVWAGEVLLSEGTASLLSSEPGREGRSLGPLQAAGGRRLQGQDGPRGSRAALLVGAWWGGVLGVSSARASWEFMSVAWRPLSGETTGTQRVS